MTNFERRRNDQIPNDEPEARIPIFYSLFERVSPFVLRHFPLIRWLDLASKTDLPRRSAVT
jgi:hypothetical protein